MLSTLFIGRQQRRINELVFELHANKAQIEDKKQRLDQQLQDKLCNPTGILCSFGAGCVVEILREKYGISTTTLPWARVVKLASLI